MVFKVHTDVGITGYGDFDWPGPPPPKSTFEHSSTAVRSTS
jgi:hypothetical protein